MIERRGDGGRKALIAVEGGIGKPERGCRWQTSHERILWSGFCGSLSL